MGDQSEIFRMMDEHARTQRARRRDEAPKILAQHDVGFTAYNSGAHLRVRGTVDLWPGSGIWIIRDTSERGRGIFALLRRLGVATDAKDIEE